MSGVLNPYAAAALFPATGGCVPKTRHFAGRAKSSWVVVAGRPSFEPVPPNVSSARCDRNGPGDFALLGERRRLGGTNPDSPRKKREVGWLADDTLGALVAQ